MQIYRFIKGYVGFVDLNGLNGLGFKKCGSAAFFD